MSLLVLSGGKIDDYGNDLLFHRLLTGEVVQGLNVTANGSPNLTVLVQPGTAGIPTGTVPTNFRYQFVFDTVVGVSAIIPTPSASNPRIDPVVGYTNTSVTRSTAVTNNSNSVFKITVVA